MKTPREILMARHRPAEARLDAIRKSVVAAVHLLRVSAGGAPSKPVPFDSPSSILHPLWLRLCGALTAPWRELILPSRRFWTALSAVWILLLIVNVSQRDAVSSVTGKAVHAPAVMMNWQVQQRWMNELMADRAVPPPEVDRPRITAPRPRTESHAIATV
jgi:hypothetical protein